MLVAVLFYICFYQISPCRRKQPAYENSWFMLIVEHIRLCMLVHSHWKPYLMYGCVVEVSALICSSFAKMFVACGSYVKLAMLLGVWHASCIYACEMKIRLLIVLCQLPGMAL